MTEQQVVLVVDDIADNLNVAAGAFMLRDIDVLLANSGAEAIKTAQKFQPDLILLDIMMPEMDGFEVCDYLKKNEATRNIPIIFLTGIDNVERIVKGFELGAVDYITKPFNLDVLLARVETHLSIVRMQKEKDAVNLYLEEKIAERTKEIQAVNNELILEIEERKLIEKELKQNYEELVVAKAKAEESDRLKTAFLNTISHEVRTPLNGIMGFVNLLRTEELSKEELNSFFIEIEHSSNLLLEIFSDIMIVSSLHGNQIKVLKKDFSLKDLLERIDLKYSKKANEKQLDFVLYNSSPVDYMNNDSQKLEEILTKLLDNAIKYTENGRIELFVDLNETWLEFRVKDTGIGIERKYQKEIFEKFIQADGELTRKYGGTGLGLAIAKAYVDLLEGEIELKSSNTNGSSFVFRIPF